MDDAEKAEEMLRRHAGPNKKLVKVWEYLTSVENKVMIYVEVTI